ncbi:Hypothetical predicted protein [Cloeon dipterum]|uniref:Dynein heavy chain linker domain-containing protein n=1 Tax=Cloeon dipterum TaxID=197152 RepID=A0A8S1BRV1_9INSE|nr:Hypothetical predicted protein [Cloeon dipterum]
MDKRPSNEDLAPPAKYRKKDGPLDLMDRSGIVTSCFVRRPENRGKMPVELIGSQYKEKLTAFLHRTVDVGTKWQDPASKMPEEQIRDQLRLFKEDIKFELTSQELEYIEFYLTEGITAKDVEQMPAHVWERAVAKTIQKYASDKRLQSLFAWLRKRAESDWDRGSREALLKEALREPWQQERLGVRKLPPPFPRIVIAGPAPWRQSFLEARNFCENSLMAASTVVLTMNPIWNRLLENYEFLSSQEIADNRPWYLYELEEKVITSLENARKRILHFIFRCAEHMWRHQKQWDKLLSREHGVSADMVRLLNCITSLTCRRLRVKTLATVDAWTKLILSYQPSDCAEEKERPKPLIKFKLDITVEQLGMEMIRAREFIASSVPRIFEVTKDLPSVGTIMFNPNHTYKKV